MQNCIRRITGRMHVRVRRHLVRRTELAHRKLLPDLAAIADPQEPMLAEAGGRPSPAPENASQQIATNRSVRESDRQIAMSARRLNARHELDQGFLTMLLIAPYFLKWQTFKIST